MIETEIMERLKNKPYLMNMGAGNLAKLFKVSRDTIYSLKNKIREKKDEKLIKVPKILIFDIETAPLRAYVWSRWKQNIFLEQTIAEWFCICWSAKWLYANETMVDVLTPEEIINEDDSRIMEKLWHLFDEADIIIAHNGIRFDIAKCNSRFILLGFPPPSTYQVIDTKVVTAKQFGFSSNKLDALAGYFGIEHKMDTDFDLWVRCLKGDAEALQYMATYNIKDTEILEEVYLKLRPWIKNHPNVGMYLDSKEPICSSCGSHTLESTGKYYYTQTAKYELFRCECGALSRGRVNLLNKDVRKNLITRIPK